MAVIQPTSFWETQLYTTIRLELGDNLESDDGTLGTGFFYNHPLPAEGQLPLLITNRHNVRGSKWVGSRFHTLDTSVDYWKVADQIRIVLPLQEEAWTNHPDSNVDLAGIPLSHFQKYAEMEGKELAIQAYGPSFIPPDLSDFDALEDVVMIGYPGAEGDLINNYPLLLRGSTATHPGIDYENNPTFVLNIASFEGSSGSPVIVVNNVNRTKPSTYFSPSRPFALLGVFYNGPRHKVDGSVIASDNQPLSEVTVQAHIPMNVGYAVKAKEVQVLATKIAEAMQPTPQ